ncbi:MAG: DeoR/GlpR family DNA-binding transcription regulator [Actinobacteria bacterium]|nr:DeoR/GlpR family DNA-binding transcription regulator [Actinomycetota bacterium]
MKIFTEERQNKIAELINNRGRITVPELADEFNISVITIRRDLKELENRGVIKRTHGGAIRYPKSSQELQLEDQMELRIEEKKRIAKFAVSLLDDGDSLILEACTTNIYCSDFIPNNKKLKIFTNSPIILSNLRKFSYEIEVFCSGGFLKNDSYSLVGYDTTNYFSHIIADKAFVSIGGINNENIITIASQDELEVKKSIIKSAKKIIALSDSSKFNSNLLYKVGSIDIMDILVTDKGINPQLLNKFMKMGIKVYAV